MKAKIILIGIMSFVTILYVVFYSCNVIKTYDNTNFITLEQTGSYEELSKMLLGIIDNGDIIGSEGFADEYYKNIKDYIKIRDYSKKGIICENVWVVGNSQKLSKYVVVYNDRTVKCITGKFTINPTIYAYNDEYMRKITGRNDYSKNISNVIFIKDVYEEKEVKLSLPEYFILINKLKLINMFKEDTEDGKVFPRISEEDYVAGFYMNDYCYVYAEKPQPEYMYKFKMGMRMNCDDYINKCIGYSDEMMAGKEGYGAFMLNL